MEETDDLSGSASDGYERRRVRISTQILDAAEQLLREHGDDGFTMADVARTSGVSPATPFNHFEHKIGMLAALFRRSLSVVGRMRVRDVGPDPRDRVVEDAVWSADIYARDPSLYRPLLRALLSHPPRGVFKEATQLWVGGLEACRTAGWIDDSHNVERLAEHLETAWYGALSLWAVGEINRPELKRRIRETTALILAGASQSADD